jgi:glycosyltransferase involved in cell wall biosynthesis
MNLGLLPALGGSLTELRRTGQDSRLIDGYLRRYVEAFENVSYFSYAPEALGAFTDDPRLLERVMLFPPSSPRPRALRAWAIPRQHAAAVRACAVLRVFQITGVIPALLAQRRFGVPYVTSYGFWYGQLSRPGPRRVLKAFVERLGLRRAAAVIVPTEELQARASRLAKRVVLIPNGVDTRRFAPQPGAPARGDTRCVLYVGRLSAEKNLTTVVDSGTWLAKPSTQAIPDTDGRLNVTYRFVGSGALLASLRTQARELKISVEFPGVVDQTKLPAVYSGADVFVLASLTEGHPKVLLEAMACGIPVVASNRGGIPSIVTDGETGLLFDPTSSKQLADCLRRVLQDPGLARRLGRAGRALVVERYDLGPLVEREITLLHDVARTGS